MRVFNPQPTPLIYKGGRTIPGYHWVEGEKSDFQDLIDKGLVKFEPESDALELKKIPAQPAPVIEPEVKVEPEVVPESIENPVVSPPTPSKKKATIEPSSTTSEPKE